MVAERDAAVLSVETEGGRASGLPIRLVVGALVAGALIGGALGALAGSRAKVTSRAVTVLSVLPNTAVTNDANAGGGQDATSFIQTELVKLNGQPLRTLVQKQLRLDSPPDISSTQLGQTYVVNVTAAAGTDAEALAAAGATADAYAKQRREQINADVGAALATVGEQINASNDVIAKAPKPVVTGGGSGTGTVNGRSLAYQGELQRLIALQNTLQVSQAGLDRVVTVLQPPVLSGGSSLSPRTRDAAAGGLLGVLLALALLLLRQRFSDRILTASAAGGLGVDVLLPELPRVRRSGSARSATATRLLAARLTRGGDADSGPSGICLVLVAVSRGTGTSTVVDRLAAEIAQQQPVLVVRAVEAIRAPARGASAGVTDLPSHPTARQVLALLQRGPVDGVEVLGMGTATSGRAALTQQRLSGSVLAVLAHRGWAVLIDAPALADSPLGLELGAHVAGTVLVVGLGVTHQDDVRLATDLFAARGLPLVGAIVSTPGRRRPDRPARPPRVSADRADPSDRAARADRADRADAGAALRDPAMATGTTATTRPVAVTSPATTSQPPESADGSGNVRVRPAGGGGAEGDPPVADSGAWVASQPTGQGPGGAV